MLRRLYKWGLGIVLLLFIFGIANWYQTRKGLVRYCRETIAGTSLDTAKENARRYGFRFINSASADHKAFVTASGVMGRYVCEIDFDGERVVKTRLNFDD